MGPVGFVRVGTFLLIGLIATPVAQAAGSFQTIALSGQQVPDQPAGVSFASFSFASFSVASWSLNTNGQVAFRATLAGAGVDASNDSAFVRADTTDILTLARAGSAAPGTSASFAGFTTISSPSINNAGQVSFFALLTGAGVTTSNDTANWRAGTGLTELLTREGDPAPVAPSGPTFLSVDTFPQINSSGATVFSAVLTGPGVTIANRVCYALATPGNTQFALRMHDPAPGGVVGEFIGMPSSIPQLNDAGKIALGAPIVRDDNSSFSEFAIMAGLPGALQTVARQGQGAPGTSAGISFGPMPYPIGNAKWLNGAGQVAFRASLTGSGATSANNSGIWVGTAASLQLAAREGDLIPGQLDGACFGEFAAPSQFHVLSDTGHVAFRSTVTGPSVTTANDNAVFVGKPGSMRTLAREGSAAPDMLPGVAFNTLSEPSLNSSGTVFIRGTLTGTDVTSANDLITYFARPDGPLTKFLREGDLFDVDDSAAEDLRTISVMSPILDQTEHAFESYQVAVHISFTDGSSGIFITSIPEPTCIAMFSAGALALLAARRR